MTPTPVRHEIPVLETRLHIASEFCPCEPVPQFDEETGCTVYYHIHLNNDHLIDDLNIGI